MYDFDESQLLTLDEMVLAFRSTLSGLSKLSKIDPPTEAEVEQIVVLGFDSIRKAKDELDIDTDFSGIEKDAFLTFCLNTPEIMSWIEFFDDLEEYELQRVAPKPVPRPVPFHTDRNPQQEAAMNPTIGGFDRRLWERKGPASAFLPRSKWENVMPFLSPARLPDQPRDLPVHNCRLEWVYGYNAHSSRQSLFYSAKGEIVYAAGCICIIQDVQKHTQRFFVEHTDAVTCLKLFHTPDGDTIVASGECGVRPAVHVWDAETCSPLSTLRGFHRKGILQLDFSPDRAKLITLGADTYHSIAIYLWETRERIFGARTTFENVLDVRFLSDDIAATCGTDHVYFWRETKNGTFKRYRGLFGTAVRPETLYTVIMVGSTVVTGSQSGMLHVWEGRNLISSIKGHTGAVYAAFVVDQGEEKGLVTACTSGKIQVWNSKLEVGATFNSNALGTIQPAVVSVCWDLLTSKILLGFKTCEIFEMDATDGRNVHSSSIVAAHSSPRVCGVAAHPMNPRLFCTVGDDRSVRIYNTELRKLLRVSLLDTMGHCCAFSPDGQLILVGLGSGIEGREERKEGAFVVLNEEDLTLVHEARDAKYLISDCKFSPDGELLALGCLDGAVYVYNARDYAARAKCRGHTGRVIHIDFSNDGQFLASNCTNGELLFWDAEKGELQTPKSVKEMQWETNSCVYSYATQGLWGPYDDKTYNNATCRSHARDLIAAVDNYGRIRIVNAPCVSEDPNFILCNGHAAEAQNCCFSCDDSMLFTTGGTDGTVCQWKIILPDSQDYEEMKKDASVATAVAAELRFDGKFLERNDKCEDVLNDRPLAVCLMEEGLEDVSQMQPWQRTIVAPSRVPAEDSSEPPDVLELEFVYGYTADRSRQSIMYAPDGDAIFFAAAIAVIMNQKRRAQRYYFEHPSTITAMAVCREEGVVATGDQGEIPTVRVWEAATFKTLCVLEGFHRRGISHLAFSPDGQLLVTVGQDRFRSIAVYEWRSGQIISHTQGIQMKSFFVDVYPSGTGMIQCGNEVVRFWEFQCRNMLFTDALLGSRAKLQGFLCAGWIGNNAVVGTADGSLYRFVGRQLDGIVQAHGGCVNSITSSNDGICTGSIDGFVKIWTRTLECRLVVEMRNLKSISVDVRVVNWDTILNRILIGTLNGEIFEINAGDGENLHPGPLLEGHAGDELWGLAVNPVKEEFVTVGDDSLLRVWDIFSHSAVRTVPLEMPARCCCFNPDGRHLVVGFGSPRKVTAKQYDGKWVVLDTNDYQVIHEARDSTKWITDVKYSNNGEMIAMGSFDNKIYVYNVFQGYNLTAAISQHASFITALDFSEDNAWIQSNCGGFELNFFEADTGIYIPAASRLRDNAWATQTCMLGWGVQGIWPAQKDGTEITACDCNLFRGGDGTIVAAGDNYGRVSLFRYPCTTSFAAAKRYRAAASQITRIRFCAGDSLLISLAGPDKTIFQWAHKRDRSEAVAWNVVERRGEIEEEEDDVMKLFNLVGADEALPEVADMSSLVSSRPWVASLVAPTDAKESVPTMPDYRLELGHIFALQSSNTRASVRFNSIGDLIYPASRYVCIYNKKRNEQIFYDGHDTEISCICVSRCGKIAASVERCNRPRIHIWDASTCQVLRILPVLHRRGVSFMQFSADRKKLVSIGQDQDHSIALWESPSGEWFDGRILATAKGDVNPALYCSFYDAATGGYLLASGGRFHQKFWYVDGRCLNANYPEYDSKQKIGTLLCGTSVEHNFVSGSTSGHLFVWHGRKLIRMVRAHELGVTCIWSCNRGVITAAKDGLIKLWSNVFEHIRSFMLSDADVPPIIPCVRSIDAALSLDGSNIVRILASTASGEIFEVSARSGNICLVHESHYIGELWGLCVHPRDPDLFVTCGDDKTVRVWSVGHRRMLRKVILDCTARCVGWSHDGRHIIVGMGGSWDGKRGRKDGAFIILDAVNLKPVFEGRYVNWRLNSNFHIFLDLKFLLVSPIEYS